MLLPEKVTGLTISSRLVSVLGEGSRRRETVECMHSTKLLLAAGNFFLVAILPIKGKDLLVGYTCATLTSSGNLTHDSMARHDPDGTTLCIHSVCVDQNHRRRGIAKRMLQAYVVFVQQTSPQVSVVFLSALSAHE